MAINDQSRWRYVVTNLSGDPTGAGVVVNASGKQYSYNLNGGRTSQITLNIDNPTADFLLTNDALLKVYRKTRFSGTWQLMMVGDVIHVEEAAQGDAGLVTVVATDPYWRLQRRMVGTGVDGIGRGLGYGLGTPTSLSDVGLMIQFTLAVINATFYSGIDAGSWQASIGSYLGNVYMQNVGDLFQQWTALLGAPDFELQPIEPTGIMPNTHIALLNIWASLGTNQPNCIFEYGMGAHNVISYDRLLTKDGLCNQAFSIPQGFPSTSAQNDTMVIGQDTTSINAISLFQDEVSADLASIPLRQELADEYVAVRKYARQQIVFSPTVDCPLDYGVDYNVGDTVTARAMVNGRYRFNGTARIYGVSIAVDDNDAETVSLTLIPGG